MAKQSTIVETEYYELPLDFYLKCEFIAAQLEITVDYLLEEFYDDGELIVPDFVQEWATLTCSRFATKFPILQLVWLKNGGNKAFALLKKQNEW